MIGYSCYKVRKCPILPGGDELIHERVPIPWVQIVTSAELKGIPDCKHTLFTFYLHLTSTCTLWTYWKFIPLWKGLICGNKDGDGGGCIIQHLVVFKWTKYIQTKYEVSVLDMFTFPAAWSPVSITLILIQQILVSRLLHMVVVSDEISSA